MEKKKRSFSITCNPKKAWAILRLKRLKKLQLLQLEFLSTFLWSSTHSCTVVLLGLIEFEVFLLLIPFYFFIVKIYVPFYKLVRTIFSPFLRIFLDLNYLIVHVFLYLKFLDDKKTKEYVILLNRSCQITVGTLEPLVLDLPLRGTSDLS